MEHGDGGGNQETVDQIEADEDSDEEILDVDHENEKDGEGNNLPNEDSDKENKVEQLDVVEDTTTTEIPIITTASRRTVNHPTWQDEYEIGLTAAEERDYEAIKGIQSQDPNELF